MMGRIASMFGSSLLDSGGLERLFPSPAQLANAAVERAGVASPRAEAIRILARQGVLGPGTAEYVALRASGEPDAFPGEDRLLRRMAGGTSASELVRRSEAWRPWRAYAAVLLWQGWNDEARRKTHARSNQGSLGRIRSRGSLGKRAAHGAG
jgi:AraC family transcriptional regulator of adaptative response / DNA-3-methyladenine glycosylase II